MSQIQTFQIPFSRFSISALFAFLKSHPPPLDLNSGSTEADFQAELSFAHCVQHLSNSLLLVQDSHIDQSEKTQASHNFSVVVSTHNQPQNPTSCFECVTCFAQKGFFSVYVPVCGCVCVGVWMGVWMDKCVCVCVCVCVCLCVYVCMHLTLVCGCIAIQETTHDLESMTLPTR